MEPNILYAPFWSKLIWFVCNNSIERKFYEIQNQCNSHRTKHTNQINHPTKAMTIPSGNRISLQFIHIWWVEKSINENSAHAFRMYAQSNEKRDRKKKSNVSTKLKNSTRFCLSISFFFCKMFLFSCCCCFITLFDGRIIDASDSNA